MADQYPEGKRTGMINYQNFLKRFLDLGFNNADCINELIDNAIDAGAQNITIELVKEVQAEKEKHYLQVVDDGTGMDELSFVKFFEMFGDKTDATLHSLGKKGIGGKVALVTLSKLNDTMVVSKTNQTELLYTKVSWGKLREAGNICINEASKKVEKLWEETQLVSAGHGTIAIIDLSSLTHNELESIISSGEINERNVYYTVCRNYFRHLQNGKNITFINRVNTETITTLKCVPLDPLYLQYIENPVYKGVNTLHIYKNLSANGRVEVLVQKGDVWIGYVQNKRPGNIMKIWKQSDIDDLDFVGEIRLEHSYLMFEHEKDDSSDNPLMQRLKEKHILETLFPRAKFNKDDVMSLTCGTHLERNKKETGLLLHAQIKKAGDYDKREFFNQSRHRLIFECTSSNDDLIDTVFQTQINKSKVDANELPEVLTKTIKKLNEDFAISVYTKVTSQALSTQESSTNQVQQVETNPNSHSQTVIEDTQDVIPHVETSMCLINDANPTNNVDEVTDQSRTVENALVKRETVKSVVHAGNADTQLELDKPVHDDIPTRETPHTAVDVDTVETFPKHSNSSKPCIDHVRSETRAHSVCEKVLLDQLLHLQKLFKTNDIKDIETLCSNMCIEEQLAFCEHFQSFLNKLNVKM